MMALENTFRLKAAARALAAFFLVLLTVPAARAQSLSVLPVNIFLSPGQAATSLTVTNQGTSETAIQIRAYAWSQKDGDEQLTASDAVLLSPPLAKIAPGTSQVVRLILRKAPQGQEASYRILIDQIPPPSEPGVVHVVLRLSIPIFAKPAVRCLPDVKFHIENEAGQFYLVAMNTGNLHELIRDVVLTADDGRTLKAESAGLPYILPGATRRWHIVGPDSQPLQVDTLRLTARMNSGAIDQKVRFVSVR
jgi:fimbrial chaperone protein